MMLTAAVTLAMMTTTPRAAAAAAASGKAATSSCDEAALDREYDNCVALLHTGKGGHERNRKDPHEFHFTYIAPFCKHLPNANSQIEM